MELPSRLPDVFVGSSFRRHGPGVYAVVAISTVRPYREHLLYIGSSVDMPKRTGGPRHIFSIATSRLHPFIVLCRYYYTWDFRQEEVRLIKELKPILNKHHNG